MPKYRPLPPTEQLRSSFRYEPSTGFLFRKDWGANVPSGSLSKSGYVVVGFGGPGQYWAAHRLIWRIVTGDDPGALQIDHVNRIRHDNRWENLRLADRQLQMANRGALATSSTGLKGAYKTGSKRASRKPYKSSIMRDGKHVFLGYFDTPQEAQAAYVLTGGVL